MISNSYLTCQGNKITYLCTPCNADLGNDNRIFTNCNIMSYLDKIVYLRACTYYRISCCCPVNRDIRAYLNVILNNDTSHLRNFIMFAFLKHITKTI